MFANFCFCIKYRQYCTHIVCMISTLILLIYFLHPQRFASHYSYILKEDISRELEPAPLAASFARTHEKELCPLVPDNLSDELMYPNKTLDELDSDKLATDLGIGAGGVWQPQTCVSQHQVSIVIPYRNRTAQLNTFLVYMHPFLQKQMINYRIIIVEQSHKMPFNRAALFNIGYAEALKLYPYHCFIFHDVDLIPQKLSNMYGCTRQPRHMSSSLDTFRYNLPYTGLFGGVVSLQNVQFHLVNGFSNVFYGWGGEDDDFHERVVHKGMNVCRFAPDVSRYSMLAHAKELPSEDRIANLQSGRGRFETDGLNSLKYSVMKLEHRPLYTWINVDLL